jgi:hypothetical protein
MNPSHELRSLIGTPVMSAINTLSAMGFSCKDISKEAVRPSLKIAGVLHCTQRGSHPNSPSLSVILPFSGDGIILDVRQAEDEDAS